MFVKMNRSKVASPVGCSRSWVQCSGLGAGGLASVIGERCIRSRSRQRAFHFQCFEIFDEFGWRRFEKLQQ
jgi:hypothetical protein